MILFLTLLQFGGMLIREVEGVLGPLKSWLLVAYELSHGDDKRSRHHRSVLRGHQRRDGELLQCHGIEWSFNQCQTNDYTAARSLVGLVDWTPQRGTPGTS